MYHEPSTGPWSGPDTLVQEIIADYVKAMDAGKPPNPQALIEQYPAVAAELQKFFADQQAMDAILDDWRRSAAPVACGRFTVTRPLGEGGMGRVAFAHDAELDRTVALKRVKNRFQDDNLIRQRLLREAAITAKLEHPGVVPIYGLVRDEQGQPCYAMRVIQGESLDEAIQRYHQSTETDVGQRGLVFRSLLQRFINVCQTMAYAHHKGIIHRDLKPANIMLGAYGETLVVDWGLAKQIDQPEELTQQETPANTGATSHDAVSSAAETDSFVDSGTQTGQALGTPAFMSPEQAAGQWATVGPASDIYSLGATLYALLTGRPAFTGENVTNVLQKVMDGDLVRPGRVKSEVPTALEAICLKAMALNPNERYGAAKDVATDVEHWLADEPVSAYAEPWQARFRRWLRRHRAWVGSGVIVLVIAILALVAVTVMATTHSAELGRKNRDLEEANRQETEAKQREQDVANLGQETVQKLTSPRTLAYLIRLPSLDQPQKEFLDNAVYYYRRFTAHVPADESGRWRQANAYFQMGRLLQVLGERAHADEAYGQSGALSEQLAAAFPDTPRYRQFLARCKMQRGNQLRELGRYHEAEEVFGQAQGLQSRLTTAFPNEMNYQSDMAATLSNLAALLADTGNRDRAVECYREAIQRQQQVVERDPHADQTRQFLANHYHNLGILLRTSGKSKEAVEAYAKALAIREQLVAEFPDEPEYLSDLARAYQGQAKVAQTDADVESAAAHNRLWRSSNDKASPSNRWRIAASMLARRMEQVYEPAAKL